jgi:hypothetical protein
MDNLIMSLSSGAHRRGQVILIAFLTGVALTPWALIGITYVLEAVVVDRCLDSGGSFDYNRMVCDESRSHPYVSFVERRTIFVRTMAFIGSAAIASVATFVLLERNPRKAS